MKTVYVVRGNGVFGFGPTAAAAVNEFRRAGGKSVARITKVTHPDSATPVIDEDGSIQFPAGQDGTGTTYEEVG